ncbi:MAG: efflux RND transporter periplasmic adaptor subunit, partial [Myxococcales bacterium]|nr:efflux RND transporter periplasmic adaptor subunit [Myxococcales bacterium]
ISDIDAQLEQLENERGRTERLIAAEIGTEATLERIESDARRLEAARDAASAQRAEAQRMRDETSLVSPVSGTVAEVYAEPGEVVGPGSPVALIIGEGAVEIEIDVPEAVFVHLSEGQHVNVDFPLSNRRDISATISAVGRVSAGRGRLFPVVVSLPSDADIVPGMAGEVRVSVPIEGDAAVPVGSLVHNTGEGPSVFRIVANQAERVPVEVTGLEGELALVRGAVAPGDQLVVAGHALLEEHSLVEAIQ